MSQIPLARFLDRFGIALTVIVGFAVSLGIVSLILKRWKSLAEWEQKTMDDYFESEKAGGLSLWNPYKPTARFTPSFTVGVLLTVALAWILYVGLKELSSFHEKVVTGTVFIAALATILFWLKIKSLLIYAAMEIFAALVLAVHTMAGLRDNVAPIEMLTLLTSAYLVVRGLDNLRNGLKVEKSEV